MGGGVPRTPSKSLTTDFQTIQFPLIEPEQDGVSPADDENAKLDADKKRRDWQLDRNNAKT